MPELSASLLPLSLVCIGALGAAYSYFVYPLILLLLPESPAAPRGRAGRAASLTLIIAARNEERRIRAKIAESLALRSKYPNLEILVASDASTDGTDDIVREFHAKDVQLVRTEVHNGKEFAQRAAIRRAVGEILVFTDSGTTITPESIDKLADLFSDPHVGAVSSTDRFVDSEGRMSGEGLYIRYEMWLRALESRKCGLIGLSGSFFAARREVCDRWETDIPSDFVTALTCRMLGLRAVSDPEVIGLYKDVRVPGHELARKIRTIVRGMTALAKKRETLNPFRYGLFSFQVWSHKLMRWAVPWFALVYAAGVAMLPPNRVAFLILLLPIVILAAVSATAALVPTTRRSSVVNAGYYLVEANAAVLAAAVLFIAGRRVTTWVPTKR
jgi:glycosyltransferase involved in cell wall biosynthesis